MWFPSTSGSLTSRGAADPHSASPRRPLAEPLESRRLMAAAPAVSVADLTVVEGNAGTRTALVTVSLSAASNKSVAVSFRTENTGSAASGVDYQAASGTLTFAPGQTRKTAAVPVYGDRAAEPDETFAVRLLGTSRGAIADGFAVVTVVDDEPRVSISDASELEGCGCGGVTTPMVFTVSLATAYDQPVTVNYATTDGTATVAGGDYRTASGTLTFAPGETSKTITVDVLGDTAAEFDEMFVVDLTASSLAVSILNGQGTGWILNDDGDSGGPGGECTPDHPYYPNC